LAILRALYSMESETTPRGRALRRSYLAMLYAHYEGFCKQAWEECQIEISRCGRPLSQIRCEIASQFLADEISNLRNESTDKFVDGILGFRLRLMDTVSPPYKKHETSNLWPSVLSDVLEKLNLSTLEVRAHQVALKSLVARRNDIAHGENVGVSDADLQTMHNAVWDVILALIIDVVKYFEDRRYLK